MKKISNISNLFVYVISFAASFIGIALNFFLAKILQAESYGNLQYLLSIATLIAQVAIFGLNSFLIKESKNELKRDQIFTKCSTLYLTVFFGALPILYYVLCNYVPVTMSNNIITFSVIGVGFLMGLNMLISAYWQGSGKYHLSLIFENLLPKSLLFICAIVFLIISQLGLFESLYLILYFFIYGLISVPIVIKEMKGFNLKFTKSEFASILFFFGVTITYNIGNELTKVLQGGLYHNEVALATISISTSILNLISVFTKVINNLAMPIFSKHARNKDIKSLLDVYRLNTRLNSYISIPFYLFFIIFSKNFLSFFGDSYTEYYWILGIMSISNTIGSLTGPNGTMLAMTGYEKYELLNGGIYFATYLIFVWVFSFDKVYGLCLALLVSTIVVNIAKYIECSLLYKTTPLDGKTFFTISSILVINALLIAPLMLISNFWLWLALGVLIGICAILLNTFVISFYRKTDFKDLLALKI